ncbi:MAG: hypothetical protein WDA75_00160 [Candidatus Latescibacterota bacterium]|jgi:hypothetical protein
MPRERWERYHAHELTVLPRWYAGLAAMDESDLVVYHPCYQSAEEKALAEHGRRHLGSRFLTLSGREVGHPDGIPAPTMAALAPEITAAFRVRGKYTWSVHDLRIAVFSRHYAQDLLALLAERGISVDMGRLALQAWGESFEGCVTTWSTMVPPYLGCPSRVEIPYEMTVPDTLLLLSCEYQGRTALDHDTALYLYQDAAGRSIAHYKRERVALADSSFYAELDLPPDSVAVLDGHGRELLPAGGELIPTVPPSLVHRLPAGLQVMVASGRGRGGEGPHFYPREAALFISSRDIGSEAFRARALQARIIAE